MDEELYILLNLIAEMCCVCQHGTYWVGIIDGQKYDFPTKEQAVHAVRCRMSDSIIKRINTLTEQRAANTIRLMLYRTDVRFCPPDTKCNGQTPWACAYCWKYYAKKIIEE